MRRHRERRPGRYPGQGWYLEDATYEWLLSEWWPVRRVPFWIAEVDVVARREGNGWPRRLLVSCKDWFEKQQITPCVLWRLIALSMTARAEPVLVHNHQARLTAKAQRIAERWRVRLVTDKDVQANVSLPEPERPPRGINTQYPPVLGLDVEPPYTWAPDYYGWLDPDVASDVLEVVH